MRTESCDEAINRFFANLSVRLYIWKAWNMNMPPWILQPRSGQQQVQSQIHFRADAQSVRLGIDPLLGLITKLKLIQWILLSVIRRAACVTTMKICPSSEQQQQDHLSHENKNYIDPHTFTAELPCPTPLRPLPTHWSASQMASFSLPIFSRDCVSWPLAGISHWTFHEILQVNLELWTTTLI